MWRTGKIIRLVFPVCIAFTVHVEPHAELLRVADLIGRHQPRADRAEGVAALALVPGATAVQLKFALAHIVHQHVAGDVAERLRLLDVARRACR